MPASVSFCHRPADGCRGIAEGQQAVAGDQGDDGVGAAAATMDAGHGVEDAVHIEFVAVEAASARGPAR